MSDSLLILGVQLAGAFHFVTLLLACFTPIPPDWEKNLAALSPIHRRFALAQNFSIGATIAVLGFFSLFFAPELVGGSPLARAVCGATALFWGGRLVVLPWLSVRATVAPRCSGWATASCSPSASSTPPPTAGWPCADPASDNFGPAVPKRTLRPNCGPRATISFYSRQDTDRFSVA